MNNMTNEVIQAIKQRRSVREYLDKPVDKDIIEEIIQAGKYAPSAKNMQPWKFIVITDKSYIQDLSLKIKDEIKKIIKKRYIKQFQYKELKDQELQKFIFAMSISSDDLIFFKAPVLIFVLTEDKRLFYDESCACCAQNMMLTAHSLGLGSCWIGFASFLGLNKSIMKKIGIPDGYHISAALIFGYHENKVLRAPMRKITSDIIKWIE